MEDNLNGRGEGVIQEFNTRIDQVETLNVERYNEVMNILVDILDRLEILEIRLKEMN